MIEFGIIYRVADPRSDGPFVAVQLIVKGSGRVESELASWSMTTDEWHAFAAALRNDRFTIVPL